MAPRPTPHLVLIQHEIQMHNLSPHRLSPKHQRQTCRKRFPPTTPKCRPLDRRRMCALARGPDQQTLPTNLQLGKKKDPPLNSGRIDTSQHENNGTMDPPLNRHINAIDSLQTLHRLSRTWNMIYEDLGDLSERLDFLISTTQKLASAGIQTRTVVEHLNFARARNCLRRIWVTSFAERTKLIVGFVFSLASQEHSKANVRIAVTSSFIARETQKDNSSMMTLNPISLLLILAS
jgi:hypothetical protein